MDHAHFITNAYYMCLIIYYSMYKCMMQLVYSVSLYELQMYYNYKL